MGALKVLVVEDDAHQLQALSRLLENADYLVTATTTAESALDCCRFDTFHLALCDLRLPGKNGFALVRTLREACPQTALVLMTGYGSIRSAVTALKLGAVEYLTKPIKPRRLLDLCSALTRGAPTYLANRLATGQHAPARSFDGMQARSATMQALFERIELAARSDAPVLVTGESGTGKALAARAVHDRSRRSGGPFVVVPTGVLPSSLVAGELFGGDGPAAKLAAANGGTLFIDEVAVLDARAQAELLGFLETSTCLHGGRRTERTTDVRVIAASSRDPASLAPVVRPDLLARLCALDLRIPPLRQRPEDVAVLTVHFLREFSTQQAKPILSLPPETERLLSAYSWPGNVRELRNIIEQAVLMARGLTLDSTLLPHMLHREAPHSEVLSIAIGTPMEAIEREVILRTLAANQGNKTITASVLGISRRSIYNKLAAYESKGREKLAQ